MSRTARYVVDPKDPRAPSEEVWAALSEEERARVVASLPAEVPEHLAPPEGDRHRKARSSALDALGRFFERIGRKVYLSSELATFYPGEACFAPDVLAVVDVEPFDRNRWVVSAEGKGLDFVIEVHVAGDYAKDHVHNVARYARLGIPEYFAFDRDKALLRGFRLRSPEARAYEPIVPQHGRLASKVLGLDLALEGATLRFFHGTAALAEADELIAKLGSMVDALVEKRQEAERARSEAERARSEAERAQSEAERAQSEAERALEAERARADEAEKRLEEALAELSRLKGSR